LYAEKITDQGKELTTQAKEIAVQGGKITEHFDKIKEQQRLLKERDIMIQDKEVEISNLTQEIETIRSELQFQKLETHQLREKINNAALKPVDEVINYPFQPRSQELDNIAIEAPNAKRETDSNLLINPAWSFGMNSSDVKQNTPEIDPGQSEPKKKTSEISTSNHQKKSQTSQKMPSSLKPESYSRKSRLKPAIAIIPHKSTRKPALKAT